tara:strand:+ start:256 stop:537 length:282 start_codon:yes stop_codon:yes gene_type:complete
MTITEVLFKDKPYLILLKLLETTEAPKTQMWICWETRINFSHVTHLIKLFEKEGFVATERKGRIREVTLTTKGHIVAQKVKILVERLEEIEND